MIIAKVIKSNKSEWMIRTISFCLGCVLYLTILVVMFAMPTQRIDTGVDYPVIYFGDVKQEISHLKNSSQNRVNEKKEKKRVIQDNKTNNSITQLNYNHDYNHDYSHTNNLSIANFEGVLLEQLKSGEKLNIDGIQETSQAKDDSDELPLSKGFEDKNTSSAFQSNNIKSDNELDIYIEYLLTRVENNKIYPQIAIESQKEGVAVIGIEISENGKLLRLYLIQTSGSKILDNAAMDGVKRSAPFKKPPLKNGVISLKLETPIKFELD